MANSIVTVLLGALVLGGCSLSYDIAQVIEGTLNTNGKPNTGVPVSIAYGPARERQTFDCFRDADRWNCTMDGLASMR
jgi:hypothetical protein